MKTKTILLSIFFLLTSFSVGAVGEDLRVGTTFSSVQAGYLDQEEKETYLKVLDLGFDLIRLGAYWSRIEKTEGVFDFSVLDWEILKAKEKGVPVVLTVGMKAPRWPEYFIPEWVFEKVDLPYGSDVSKSMLLREKTLNFIKKVISRYKDEDIIKYWQVENEALNRFGGENWYIGKDFFEEEVRLVRKLDGGKRPIILTAATYPNSVLRFLSHIGISHDPLFDSLRLCDILGVNVYPIVGQKFLGINLYFRTNKRTRDKYFSALTKKIKETGKTLWITELQAEPWEPGHVAYKPKKIPVTAVAEETERFIEEFSQLGIETILLWGVEYWLYRYDKHNDRTWHEMLEKAKQR